MGWCPSLVNIYKQRVEDTSPMPFLNQTKTNYRIRVGLDTSMELSTCLLSTVMAVFPFRVASLHPL